MALTAEDLLLTSTGNAAQVAASKPPIRLLGVDFAASV